MCWVSGTCGIRVVLGCGYCKVDYFMAVFIDCDVSMLVLDIESFLLIICFELLLIFGVK